ncbi:hypothetical protein AKG06_33570 [Pseudomonas aeruginosa]|nr:hypothetical protein AKG06_33570 [Pseudomonas aeruginosa]
MQLTAVSSSCAASWSGGCPGAWRLLPVQRQLMADRVAVAAGAQLFQHQILGARIVAAQSADVEQRLQAGE